MCSRNCCPKPCNICPVNIWTPAGCGPCGGGCGPCGGCNSCKTPVCCSPCVQIGKCCFITATLGATASPTTYSGTGTIITYNYVVTNTGNGFLNGCIQITDSVVGTQFLNLMLAPGGVQTFSRTYATTAADVTAGSVTNSISAIIQVDRCKRKPGYICLGPVTVTVTYVP